MASVWAGERRLPACSFGQPAENMSVRHSHELAISLPKPRAGASGTLPDAADWQPALSSMTAIDRAVKESRTAFQTPAKIHVGR